MKLLTKDIREQLLRNGREQAKVKGTKAEKDFPPVVKLFYPAGNQTWLLTELDPEDEDVAGPCATLAWDFRNSGRCASANLKASADRSSCASNATGSSKRRRRSPATSTPPMLPVTSPKR